MDEELVAILSQIPAAITKALIDVLVIKHPGHGSQKVHGNRFGAGGEKLEAGHKRKDVMGGGASAARVRNVKGLSNSELHTEFSKAKDASTRAKLANETLSRGGFKDTSVAGHAGEIPKVNEMMPSPKTISIHGKNAVFIDDNGAHSIGPVVQNNDGDFVTGTFGRTRRVKPEFVEKRPQLSAGLEYGKDISLGDLQIGHNLHVPGNQQRGPIVGKVIKIKPKNIDYEANYMGRPMTITASKEDLRGGYVGSGKKVHKIL